MKNLIDEVDYYCYYDDQTDPTMGSLLVLAVGTKILKDEQDACEL